MKRILLLTLALVAVGCAEPTPRNLDELVQQGEWPNEVYLDRETMRPYSGPVFGFAVLGTRRVNMTVMLQDGLLHGPYEDYDENNQLYSMGSYNMGEQCGEWITLSEYLEGTETVTHPPCSPGPEDRN